MKIAVPKEIFPDERRVALVPDAAGKLVKAGHTILIEAGAGQGAYFPDQAYRDVGCEIVADTASLWKQAEILLKVQKPTFNDKLNKHEVELLSEGAVLISFLASLTSPDLIRKLAEHKITSLGMEAIPRITRAQSMDALSSMATIAGYKAVIIAANLLGKFFPMQTTAAGTLKPAKVLIIGAGVAGLQAIATARVRLQAVVEAFDTRPVVKEQVQSLKATFVELEVDQEHAQDAGGYAKELSADHIQKEKELIAKHVKGADVVITTALIPGRPAPRLITEEMVKGMQPGSVIVDLAAEMGGNCELTEPGKEVEKHNVIIAGPLNLPSTMPIHASAMYARNITTLLNHLLTKEGKLNLNFEDEITRGTVITHEGNIVHAATKAAVEALQGVKGAA